MGFVEGEGVFSFVVVEGGGDWYCWVGGVEGAKSVLILAYFPSPTELTFIDGVSSTTSPLLKFRPSKGRYLLFSHT